MLVVYCLPTFIVTEITAIILFAHTGWWMADASGIMGWAPASYLVPVDDSTLQEESQENQELIGTEKGKDCTKV